MSEYFISKNKGNKTVPGFIERQLLKVGSEFVNRLWENYGVGIDIKHYWSNGLNVVKDEDLRIIYEAKEDLIYQTEAIKKLRARFLNILRFAKEDEMSRVATALGIRTDELFTVGEDYEDLIRSAIGNR